MDKNIHDLNIEEIQPNPLQPRGLITTDSLSELVESIKEHGVLEPLVVAKTPAGFQIIAGERRWRASKIVGLKTVPAVIKETTPRGMLEMAIVENVQREDLNPIERAQAFVRLSKEFGLTTTEIAKRISKSAPYVSNSLKLLSLPDALKDGLLTGLISEGHARALSAIGDPRLMVDAYKLILKDSASVRSTEDVARRIKKKIGLTISPALQKAQALQIVSDVTDKMMEDLQKAIGETEKCKVKVKIVRSRIQTRIIILLNGSLRHTQEKLENIFNGIKEKSTSTPVA